MFDNKRGQGMSTNTIILLVIGVVILVVLILGFTLGFGKILPFLKPGNNVAEVAQKCDIACNTQAKFAYCTTKQNVVVGEDDKASLGGKASDKLSCKYLADIFE